MSQKQAKKLRKKLRAERVESAPLAVEKNVAPPMKSNLLMRRKDPISPAKAERSGALPGAMIHQGGAILHPLSERAVYQFAKKKGGLAG